MPKLFFNMCRYVGHDMQLPVILRINLVTNQLILLCPKLLLMTEIDRYPTKAFTDVMGTCLGIAEHVTPVCSFPLSGLSITQIGAAAAGAALTKPVGLAMTRSPGPKLISSSIRIYTLYAGLHRPLTSSSSPNKHKHEHTFNEHR